MSTKMVLMVVYTMPVIIHTSKLLQNSKLLVSKLLREKLNIHDGDSVEFIEENNRIYVQKKIKVNIPCVVR